MKRTLIATSAMILALPVAVAFGQTAVPAPPGPTPPLAPTAPQGPQAGTTLERGQLVIDRPRPEYDPLGIHLGAFFLYPKLELDEVYNDNVFATNSGKRDDFITVVSPTLNLRSNWSVHEIDLRAGASVGTYARNTSENYGDYFAAAAGRYDIRRSLYASGTAKYEHLHEERDSPDSPGGAAAPVEFNAYTAALGLTQVGLRVGYLANFEFRREDYNNVPLVGGGTINESTRNVDVYAPSLRVNYEVAPHYQAFVRGAGNFRVYDNSTGGVPGAVSRNSNGVRGDVGATIDLSGVTFLELFAGYLDQIYDDSRLSNISGVDFGARVVWNVTELTSVTVDGNRRVQDSNTIALTAGGLPVNSPGYLRSTFALAVDHELLRNVLLHGEATYQNDDYKGIDRTDNRIDIGAGVRYLLNRNIYLGGSYTFTNRDSSGTAATGNFSRNLFLVRLGSQL